MRDRVEKILRIVCIALAVLVVWQLVRAVIRSRPLANVTIPAVPTLAGNNESKAGTNSTAVRQTSETNRIATGGNLIPTNASVRSDAGKAVTGTNSPSIPERQNDSAPVVNGNPTIPSNSASIRNETGSGTNQNVASTPTPTNIAIAEKTGSNSIASIDVGKTGTNSPTRSASNQPANARPRPDPSMAGMPGAGKKLPDLPIAVKARVDRITDSEILGTVMRPMPMALLGIAGDVAFLRGPTGQTGLVKEGDSLGEIKLLRIGINRVLVEENGQKKELTIFNGYGGESLLAKQGETRDETIPK